MTRLSFDAATYKRAVALFPTGLTIITGRRDGTPVGMTIQSFMSLSLEPTLVALAVAQTSMTWPRIASSGAFAVNVLSTDHAHLAPQFAGRRATRFDSLEFGLTAAGNPILHDAVTWLDCRIERTVDAGDHTIVIAEVQEIKLPDTNSDSTPLLFYRSRFHGISAELAST